MGHSNDDQMHQVVLSIVNKGRVASSPDFTWSFTQFLMFSWVWCNASSNCYSWKYQIHFYDSKISISVYFYLEYVRVEQWREIKLPRLENRLVKESLIQEISTFKICLVLILRSVQITSNSTQCFNHCIVSPLAQTL